MDSHWLSERKRRWSGIKKYRWIEIEQPGPTQQKDGMEVDVTRELPRTGAEEAVGSIELEKVDGHERADMLEQMDSIQFSSSQFDEDNKMMMEHKNYVNRAGMDVVDPVVETGDKVATDGNWGK